MAVYQYPNDFSGTQWSVFDANIYVSSSAGSETPDGSPTNPYSTVQDAITASATGDKIVVGTGLYIENLDGEAKNLQIVADGIATFDGESINGILFSNFENGSKFKNLQIKNYSSAITYEASAEYFTFDNCEIDNCEYLNVHGHIVNTLVLNTIVMANADAYVNNCTFIRTQFGLDSLNKFIEIKNSIFGKECVINIESSITTYFDYCNIEPGSTINIDSNSFTDILTARSTFSQYFEYSLNIESGFNNLSMGDYSLSRQSQLINAGEAGIHIGAYSQGQSFHNSINSEESSLLDYATLTNISITDNGNYVITPPHTTGTIETVEIDLGSVTTPGKISIFAEQDFDTPPYNAVADVHNNSGYPNILTYEMRFSNIQGELATLPYKEFAWNTQPMIDSEGYGNGNINFDSISAMPVTARYFQVKITLRDETFFLLNEDGSYILRENGYKIILEF